MIKYKAKKSFRKYKTWNIVKKRRIIAIILRLKNKIFFLLL